MLHEKPTLILFCIFLTCCSPSKRMQSFYKKTNAKTNFIFIAKGEDSLKVLFSKTRESNRPQFVSKKVNGSYIGLLYNYFEESAKYLCQNRFLSLYFSEENTMVFVSNNMNYRKYLKDSFSIKDLFMSNNTVALKIFSLNNQYQGRVLIFPRKDRMLPIYTTHKFEDSLSYVNDTNSDKQFYYEDFIDNNSLTTITEIVRVLVKDFNINKHRIVQWKKYPDYEDFFKFDRKTGCE